MSTCKFHVRGSLPKNLRRSFTERIRLRMFEPLRPEEEAEERFGWSALSEPNQLEVQPHEVFQGPYLTLGFRWDRYRFPSTVLRAALAEAAREKLAKTDRERLSKAEKEELKAFVVAKLRHRFLPSMRAIDLVWNLDAGQLFFWSSSGSLHERLHALFELTFGLELVRNSPYVAAQHLLEGSDLQPQLEQVEPAIFAGE